MSTSRLKQNDLLVVAIGCSISFGGVSAATE